MGELLGPEHDTEDAVYVMAPSVNSARCTAMATWPDIRQVLTIQEVYS